MFLFGAGASHGSIDCYPSCPPLGCQLFDELRKAGGIAASINGKLADMFRQDFEEGMDEFFKQSARDIDTFLRDMAKYFAQFVPGPRNVYSRLISALREDGREAVFSTISYDLLIEIAANQIGLLLTYAEGPLLPNNLRIFKIHGSCNFLPKVESWQLTGVKFMASSQTGCLVESEVRIASPREVIEFCENRDSLAPAMAIYAPSKWTPFCANFVSQQRDWWQAEVERAELIFVIGAGVHERDSHIWEPLARSDGCLVYVDPNPEGFYRWARDHNRRRVDVIAKTFADAVPLILQYVGQSR